MYRITWCNTFLTLYVSYSALYTQITPIMQLHTYRNYYNRHQMASSENENKEQVLMTLPLRAEQNKLRPNNIL